MESNNFVLDMLGLRCLLDIPMEVSRRKLRGKIGARSIGLFIYLSMSHYGVVGIKARGQNEIT